jgi:F-type H+-transporting ATPase subunit a
VPSGTPGALIPFMVLIETVRNIIRPGTLSIRLAANMVAGHLLLTLLGSQGALNSLLIILIPSLCLLLTLEVGVACIQAYVFTVLRSLYLSETMSKEFNITQL